MEREKGAPKHGVYLLIVPWEGYDGNLMALLIAHARAMLLGVYFVVIGVILY